MLKRNKYFILLLIALAIGGIVLRTLLGYYEASERKQYADRLNKVHSESVVRIEAGINVYSTVVSSIRAFIKNSEKFPSELQLQHFLADLVSEVNFKDSIVVSWVDTNHVFRYVVTPGRIDPHYLKGLNVRELRPQSEMIKLKKMMRQDSIMLFDPINLKEGWAAFPFNFSARDINGTLHGYVAPVLNVKYLLDYTYRGGYDSLFVHSFTVNDTVDLSREAVYDGTRIYNGQRDDEYYKNFDLDKSGFIYTDLRFYGLKLRVGSAYKHDPHPPRAIVLITYTWYGLICLFCIITLVLYLKNSRLNIQLQSSYKSIALKNQQLEVNLSKIQVLIKEIHHRIKNNMQIISSLLNLQSNEQQDAKVSHALDESKRRIQSMALVHKKLYDTEDFSGIYVREYIEELVDSVEHTLSGDAEAPERIIDIDPALYFNMDTMVPLGLILNELITNSYKYAFLKPSGNKLYISISSASDQYYKLVYADNGPGIRDGINIQNSGTLGLELIHILSSQLEGSVAYNKEKGSTFSIRFRMAAS